MRDDERTALYRMFDASGALLYIGVSKDFGRRWKEHARTQPWWDDVQRQTADWFPSRRDAAEAEVAAIQAESPKYNVTHAIKPFSCTTPSRARPPERAKAVLRAQGKAREIRVRNAAARWGLELHRHNSRRCGILHALYGTYQLTRPDGTVAAAKQHEAFGYSYGLTLDEAEQYLKNPQP